MIIQVESHRGRDRFFSLLKRRPVGLYALCPKYLHDCYEVSDAEVAKLREAQAAWGNSKKGWRFSRIKREQTGALLPVDQYYTRGLAVCA